jgi:hypothetical protein
MVAGVAPAVVYSAQLFRVVEYSLFGWVRAIGLFGRRDSPTEVEAPRDNEPFVSERQRQVLRIRYADVASGGNRRSLRDISRDLGITYARVGQLDQKGVGHLKVLRKVRDAGELLGPADLADLVEFDHILAWADSGRGTPSGWSRASAARHPLARGAQLQARAAVKAGLLTKPDRCSQCGRKADFIEAHHEDYARPLDVVWLCKSCHTQLHVARKKEASPS